MSKLSQTFKKLNDNILAQKSQKCRRWNISFWWFTRSIYALEVERAKIWASSSEPSQNFTKNFRARASRAKFWSQISELERAEPKLDPKFPSSSEPSFGSSRRAKNEPARPVHKGWRAKNEPARPVLTRGHEPSTAEILESRVRNNKALMHAWTWAWFRAQAWAWMKMSLAWINAKLEAKIVFRFLFVAWNGVWIE